MRFTLAAFAALSFCVPSPAGAAEPEAPASPEVRYASRTILDFGELPVTGQVEGPEGSFVHARRRTRFRSLVRGRGDFLPELLSSIDGL